MKTLLTILALLCFVSLQAQTVNGVPINQIEAEYLQIVGTSKLLSAKVTIQIDFGQENKLLNVKDTQVLDATGRPVVLNSMVDALNFLAANGYEFVDSYAITVGSQNVYHYLMRKQ